MVLPLLEKIPLPNPIEAGGVDSFIFISPHGGVDSKGFDGFGKEELKMKLLLTGIE